jgi:hypothetical protein
VAVAEEKDVSAVQLASRANFLASRYALSKPLLTRGYAILPPCEDGIKSTLFDKRMILDNRSNLILRVRFHHGR